MGQDVLGDARSDGHGTVVWLLYKEGAAIEPRWLCHAVSDGHAELVNVFMNIGVDPRPIQCGGRSVFDLAQRLPAAQRDAIVGRLTAAIPGHPAPDGGKTAR